MGIRRQNSRQTKAREKLMPRKGENIYKRKDGRWEGRYIKSRNTQGKAKYGYVYAKTYREVKKKLACIVRDAGNKKETSEHGSLTLLPEHNENLVTFRKARSSGSKRQSRASKNPPPINARAFCDCIFFRRWMTSHSRNFPTN